MTERCPVLIADDHPAFRVGLKTIIEQEPAFHVVGEVGDGRAALEIARTSKPEIAVVDWDMPELDGLEVARRIQLEGLPVAVIILTMHSTESLVNGAINTGIRGFVLKANAVIDILECLHAVRRGEVYLSPKISHFLMRRSQQTDNLRRIKPSLELLTETEKRVIQSVGDGLTTKAIAAELGVSPRTIDTHRRNIALKLELSGPQGLRSFALLHRFEL